MLYFGNYVLCFNVEVRMVKVVRNIYLIIGWFNLIVVFILVIIDYKVGWRNYFLGYFEKKMKIVNECDGILMLIYIV